MGKLGVIGGMGPLATQLLYKKIIENTKAECDQDHIDMIILSHASIPDRTTAIKSKETEKVFSLLAEDVKMLEENGVCAISIPCNTSHFFITELQSQTEVPIINMVQKTVERIKKKNPSIKKVGLLATDGTVYTGIYEKECQKQGIECFCPDAQIQKIVMDIIYNQIKVGQKGNFEDFKIIDSYLKENGCEAGILACTELSCFRENYNLGDFYFDALDILCEESILHCDGKLNKKEA